MDRHTVKEERRLSKLSLIMKLCIPKVLSGKKLIWLMILVLFVDIILLAIFSTLLPRSSGLLHKICLAVVVITVCLSPLLLACLKRTYRRIMKEAVELAVGVDMDADPEFLKSLAGLPERFSFKDLDSATSGFSVKLGRGGFGSVYAGTLPDGSRVAVKRLEREGGGQKEFCAEIATISKVRHVNLLSLKGFCAEGIERLLVYEFMPGGSLDRWIFFRTSEAESMLCPSANSSSDLVGLDLETRCRIALETARGLAYLHEECEDTILHLDVKPQNILLDEQFRAKVSDFGLSRSMDRGQSRLLTTMRGTPGYLAPEWLSEAGIDMKTDVYGYGMVLLELISGRRSVDQSYDEPEEWFLPALAFKKHRENRAVDIVDPLLQGTLDEESFKQSLLIIKVALWCIQEDVAKRPRMKDVVQMLEGQVEVTQPPLSHNFLAKTRGVQNKLLISVNSTCLETLTLPR